MAARTHWLKLRTSEAELTAWKAKAKAAGLPLSELLRQSLERVTVKNRKDHRDLLRSLTRLGVNLNQIAAWTNSRRDALDTIDVLTHLIDLERQVAALVDAHGERS